jgi:hypothetical protein
VRRQSAEAHEVQGERECPELGRGSKLGAAPNPIGFKSGRWQSNQEDLMQNVHARRRLEAMRIVDTAANIGHDSMVFVRPQENIRGEIQANVDLRGCDLALHGRDIDANAAAMQFTGSVVRPPRFV